MYLTAYLR